MSHPLDDELTPDVLPAIYARPEDGDESYVWLAEKYKRVTSFLDHFKGDHVGVWMAERAVWSAAEPLVRAGLLTPNCDLPSGVKFESWLEARPQRVLDAHQAIKEAGDIDHHKLEGHRHRDWKAGLGQLEHHAAYEFALRGRDPFKEVEMLDWCMATARDLKVFKQPSIERNAAYGISLEDMERDLAYHAMPHIVQKFAWNNLYLPDWNMIGKGVAVFCKGDDGAPLSAGTPDEDFHLRKDVWERVGKFRWPFGELTYPRILNDDKNSDTEEQEVHLYQVGGYALHDFIGCYADHSVHPVPEFEAMSISYISPQGVNFWAFSGREKIEHFGSIFFDMVNLHYRMQGRPHCERRTKYIEPKPVKGSRRCPITLGCA